MGQIEVGAADATQGVGYARGVTLEVSDAGHVNGGKEIVTVDWAPEVFDGVRWRRVER